MPLVVAVDFDGTLVHNRFPGIGAATHGARILRTIQREHGALIILWTCRAGRQLQDAVAWCRQHDLRLFGVNHNPNQRGKLASPKVFADVYVDERGLLPTSQDRNGKLFVDWPAIEPRLVKLARERAPKTPLARDKF